MPVNIYWAKFRSNKGEAKLHTVLDYDGSLPVFIEITYGKVHESKKANSFSFPKGSVVVMDRGYVDFKWMNILDSNGSFFVTRNKVNMKYSVIKSYQSDSMLESGVLKDQVIALIGERAKHDMGERNSDFCTFWTAQRVMNMNF
ncbi:transposase [Sphingobacterium spiritivorum]|uniref:transposase n=1 Tax=Sphingobacterium spiritivorum TaxID=258 RepID=UPI003DA27230